MTCTCWRISSRKCFNEGTAARIDAIVDTMLDPRFQALHDGYGYAWIKERRTCYGWDWSPHLPGYLIDRPEGYSVSGFDLGLGEDRRKKLALEIESTFRMLKIKEEI